MTFEEKIKRLEEIASKMENTETPVEELIYLYEEGMRLSNECREFLGEAELKITEIGNGKSDNSKNEF